MKKKIILPTLCLSIMCFNSASASNSINIITDDTEIQKALDEFNSNYADYNEIISSYQSNAYDFATNITDESIEDLKNEIEKEINEAKEQNQTQTVEVLEEYLEDLNYNSDNFRTDYKNLNSEAFSGDEEETMEEIKNSVNES